MLVHTVFFTLKPDAVAEAEPLAAACRTALASIPGLAHLWAGPPAGTDEPVVDREYHVGLCITFADRAAHDAYQGHPIHRAFIERFEPAWARVRVFDFEA